MSANEQSMRRVTAIKNGTVIDHIPSGYSLTVLKNVRNRESNVESSFDVNERTK